MSKVAIIGGTGLYNLEGLEVTGEKIVETPFGTPSAPLVFGRAGAHDVIFLPRHGDRHHLIPSEVNYRANIWALKAAGATSLISVSAVGSLREELAPGGLALPTQYIDMAMGTRAKSFFGDGVVGHVSTASVTNSALHERIAGAARDCSVDLHTDKTYLCVEGPRFGTRAESFWWRSAGADVVGMTQVPEVFLAREAQLAAATICVVTDYDCWLDDPAHHVTVQQVIARYGEALGKVKQVLFGVLSKPVEVERPSDLRASIMTPEPLWGDKRDMLDVLLS